MSFAVNFKKFLVIFLAGVVLTACATQKKEQVVGQMQGDVYTGTDTVEYLATGVKDRVFFATNKSTLTTASRDTLRTQAACLRKVSLDAVVNVDLLVAKKTLSFTPVAKNCTVSVPV